MEIGDLKKQIVDCCQRLWLRGMVANHDGNISYKISDDRFLVTPTSFSKKDVTEADLLIINSKGEVLEGKHKVFSEIGLHLSIYRVRPDIACVVHGHPTAAGGIALAGKEIGVPGIPEAIVSLGRGIFSTRFISPTEVKIGSLELDSELQKVLNESDAFLIPGNGAWAVGSQVVQTYLRLELVEQIAQAHLAAQNFGGVKPLPSNLVEELLKKRPASATKFAPKDTPSPSVNDVKNLIRAELQKLINH